MGTLTPQRHPHRHFISLTYLPSPKPPIRTLSRILITGVILGHYPRSRSPFTNLRVIPLTFTIKFLISEDPPPPRPTTPPHHPPPVPPYTVRPPTPPPLSAVRRSALMGERIRSAVIWPGRSSCRFVGCEGERRDRT